MEIKKLYFRDFYLDTNTTCSNCKGETKFTNRIRFRMKPKDLTSETSLVKYQLEYQCQDCGNLKMFDTDKGPSFEDPIGEHCNCGGEYRRDKHLFCNKCFYNK